MLKELFIKNYALIDELTIPFSENLTILSGETGTGKTIIIGALGLILGLKAKTSSIRSGRDSCTVEGRFLVKMDHPAFEELREKGIGFEYGEEIIVRRTISTLGLSKSYVNGFQVSIKDLQDIMKLLIDVHGQHEHQSLLDIKNHLFLLDRYGKLHEDFEAFKQIFKNTERLKREIEKHTMDVREKERRIDILKYSLNEIERAKLRVGEDEELEREYRILKNYENIVSSIMGAYSSIKTSDSSAIAILENAISELSRIKDFAGEIESSFSELENSKILIEDIASNLKNYIDGIEYEPGRIDEILTRMELIKNIKRKYGETIEEILRYGESCRRELEGLEINEEVLRELNVKLDNELERAKKLAIQLSAQRRVSAKMLEEGVMEELSFLNMGKSKFKVGISYRERDNGAVVIDGKMYELTSSGLDNVEFLISPNIGEPLLPLKGIASGGELSRIMLAIKTILGGVDPIETFVFDEIDAGIGGKVAWAVGNRLRDLSRLKQILCITHQAQIASKGDMNIRVDKVQREGRMVTEIKILEGNEKVEEIAQMISGKKISEAALSQAYEMIKEK